MEKSILKNRLFLIMLGFKLLVIAFILYHSATGGFSPKQTTAAITLVLPLFAIYTSAMFKDRIGRHHIGDYEAHSAIKKFDARLYLFLTTLYGIAIIAVIWAKVRGSFSFEGMQTYVATIETGFGVYIGSIISSLFKKEEVDN